MSSRCSEKVNNVVVVIYSPIPFFLPSPHPTCLLVVAPHRVVCVRDVSCFVFLGVLLFCFVNQGIQVMGLSYGVIMVIFLGALVPAVANRNFQHQSKERYTFFFLLFSHLFLSFSHPIYI